MFNNEELVPPGEYECIVGPLCGGAKPEGDIYVCGHVQKKNDLCMNAVTKQRQITFNLTEVD